MAARFCEDTVDLLLRKGIYPYEYMDSWDKFEERQLPSIEDFHSTLTGQGVTEEEYQHAQRVWNTLGMRTLGDYHDLYLMTDVLLLADVFENFRNACLWNYELDPAHYVSLPSFSWDACLKYTKVELELLTDVDMYTFVEQGIRGGVSMISHRYAKANNPSLPDYDPLKPKTYIPYFDANNLYGWSMVNSLPLRDFRWLRNADHLDVTRIPDDSRTGYILEVDLDYPEELHHAHNDYPLAPERMVITDNMLSPYCLELKDSLGIAKSKVEKLVPNLQDKRNYVVHYRNLKLYLELGLKLTKIHRVLAFTQEPWMAPYIDFNTRMRQQATNKFEQDLFKLLNNSVFGKTMENVRKYVDIRLVASEEQMCKLSKRPEYCGYKLVGENLWAVKMRRAVVSLEKPVYVGFTVLDLSKLLMYTFHYKYMKVKFGTKCTLLLTDTDSLLYTVQTNDIYDDILHDSVLFDCSEYPADHKCYDSTNKKVMGKMKDEMKGDQIMEFVGLRPKMYSLLDEHQQEKKRAKGIAKNVVSRCIRHNMYRDTLFNGSCMKHEMCFIRSDGCNMHTVALNKTGLSAFDDKRYILHDGIGCVAYGHCEVISNGDQ